MQFNYNLHPPRHPTRIAKADTATAHHTSKMLLPNKEQKIRISLTETDVKSLQCIYNWQNYKMKHCLVGSKDSAGRLPVFAWTQIYYYK